MQKLKYIKMFFGTILTMLLIISIFKSCCYAYTIEEFSDLIIQLDNKLDSTSRQNGINWYINNKQRIEESIGNDFASIIYSNYSYRYGSFKAEIFTFNEASVVTGASSIVLSGIQNAKKYTFPTDSQNAPTITNYNNGTNLTISTDYDSNMAIGLIDETYTNNNAKLIDQNYLNYFDLLGAENRDLTLLPWYFANARVGGNYYNNEISFKLYDTNNNFILYLNADNKTQVNSGYLYQLEIPYTNGINNGNRYKVKYNNNIEDFFESENFIISWERETQNGEITNPSGEVTGTINLDQTNNKIDNIANKIEQQNEVIRSGDQQIINTLKEAESGEKQRQDFWEKAYNDLFTVSGDYIESKINEVIEEYSFSGDIETEKAFLDLITSNYNDFVISWGDLTTHFTIKGENIPQLTIPSGEINFSKLERENEELREAMKWVRIILGFSVGALVIKNCWYTLMHTLGVGIQVYDANKDESATITISHERDKNGKMQTTKVIRKGNERWKFRS